MWSTLNHLQGHKSLPPRHTDKLNYIQMSDAWMRGLWLKATLFFIVQALVSAEIHTLRYELAATCTASRIHLLNEHYASFKHVFAIRIKIQLGLGRIVMEKKKNRSYLFNQIGNITKTLHSPVSPVITVCVIVRISGLQDVHTHSH